MTQKTTIWIGVAAVLLLLTSLILIVLFPPSASSGFKDATAMLAFIGGAAVAIERIIEAIWTFIGGIWGTYWPLNTIRRQVDQMVEELNSSLIPFHSVAEGEIEQLLQQQQYTQDQITEIKGKIGAETLALKTRFEELKELAPDNQRVQLLTAAAAQSVSYLQKKYNHLFPKLDRDAAVANTVINGLQDFLATFKDNPGRRLISIFLGAEMGLALAVILGLDVFTALLNQPLISAGTSVILTGILIGLGSNPTHEVIRAIQEYKKSRKGENTAKPDLPTNIN
jgi:hypothetical protein